MPTHAHQSLRTVSPLVLPALPLMPSVSMSKFSFASSPLHLIFCFLASETGLPLPIAGSYTIPIIALKRTLLLIIVAV